MALYDSFVDNMSDHPPFVQKAEIYRNRKIAETVHSYHKKENKTPKILEIGIGIGTFADAITSLGWKYVGLDQNKKMVELFGEKYETIQANVPPLPESLKDATFDAAYAAFVTEHMADGIQAYQFVNDLTQVIKKDGLIVLIMPDARSMGIEFWNQDYTHRYPTTERNITQICEENGLTIEKIIFYRGPFLRRVGFWTLKLFGWLFNYRLMGRIFGHKAFFYSIYQYIRIDVMMVVCRK